MGQECIWCHFIHLTAGDLAGTKARYNLVTELVCRWGHTPPPPPPSLSVSSFNRCCLFTDEGGHNRRVGLLSQRSHNTPSRRTKCYDC